MSARDVAARLHRVEIDLVTEIEHSILPAMGAKAPAAYSRVQAGPLFYHDEVVNWLIHFYALRIEELKRRLRA